MGRAGLTPGLSRVLAGALAAAWTLTRGLPFHAYKFLALHRHHRRVGRQLLSADTSTIGLALSRRAMEVIAEPSIPRAPSVWIVPPWVDTSGLEQRRTLVDAVALLSPADLRQALFLAMAATAAISKDRRLSRWILQSYTALPWFCLRIALSKVSGALVMAEHFDRWAVLADQHAVAERRLGRRTGSSARTSLALVQHGEVASLSGDGAAGEPLPYRLDAVGTLHVYDASAEQIFRDRILSPRCARAAAVSHFQPSIVLFDPPGSDRVRVLFVGHPVCAQLHVAILSAFRERFHIDAFYKPHPAAGSADICNAQDWRMLDNHSGFPRVDMLVSYPSTLVREYAVHQIPAFVHPLGVEPDAHATTINDAVTTLMGVVEQRP